MNLEAPSTWRENEEGDIVPAQTGVNAPHYPNHPTDRRTEEMHNTHEENVDLSATDPIAEAIAANRRLLQKSGDAPITALPNHYKNATPKFVNGREALGK